MIFLSWTPKINNDNRIAELSNSDIGGIYQWLRIRGTNKNKSLKYITEERKNGESLFGNKYLN